MPRKHTKESLEPVVAVSTCWSDLLRNLGLKVSGGNHRHIKSCVRSYGISTDHFDSRRAMGWSRGKNSNNDSSVAKRRSSLRRSDSEILVANYSGSVKHSRLRECLESAGIPHVCSSCGLEPFWNGKELTLHVDHVNGISNDNRLDNLRFLCPNCHQQTDTWGNS